MMKERERERERESKLTLILFQLDNVVSNKQIIKKCLLDREKVINDNFSQTLYLISFHSNQQLRKEFAQYRSAVHPFLYSYH